jgi:hypothetical protein
MRETPLAGIVAPTDVTEEKAIRTAWKKVRKELGQHVKSGVLSPKGMLMFVDGTPHLPKQTMRQVWEWRVAHEPQTMILRWLQRKGATLQGTEDFCLVMAQMWTTLDPELARRSVHWIHNFVIQRRDRYIARRIARLVPAGGAAILFIGNAHHVHRRLRRIAPDFRIRRVRGFDDVFKKYSGT